MSGQNNRYSPPLSEVGGKLESRSASGFLVRFVAVLMAVQGTYSLFGAFATRPYGYSSMALAVVAFAAAAGLWLRQSWSQYFVYALSATILFVWTWQYWNAVQMGAWPYERISSTVVGFIITLPPVLFAIGASVVAFRFFRVQSYSFITFESTRGH
jgi:hypothetical protein